LPVALSEVFGIWIEGRGLIGDLDSGGKPGFGFLNQTAARTNPYHHGIPCLDNPPEGQP